MTTRQDVTTILGSLGLTQTEAMAYVALLEEGPGTGYEVARRMSIARANAYSALDALSQRRLVERQAGTPAQFHAIEPTALVGRLAARFAAQLDDLEDAFERFSNRAQPPTPVLERIEGDAGARAALERIGARAQQRLSARLPEAARRAFEPFSRGLAHRRIAVDAQPTPAGPLGYVLVDDHWAAVWLSGGAGLWGNEPFLLAIVQRLLAS